MKRPEMEYCMLGVKNKTNKWMNKYIGSDVHYSGTQSITFGKVNMYLEENLSAFKR